MKIFDGLYGFIWTSMAANNCNSYLIDGPARVLIDPGHLHLFDRVASRLNQLGLDPGDLDLVISTHAHPDHFEAVKLFKDTTALFAMHETDWQLVKEMGRHLGAALELDSYIPDFFLAEGEMSVKGLGLRVIHTPGHSPGSICLYWKEKKALFSGDLLFKDGLGRTDLPGGNGKALKESIKRLEDLEIDWVLPGHGDVLSGAEAVRDNFKRIEQMWFGYI